MCIGTVLILINAPGLMHFTKGGAVKSQKFRWMDDL